MLYTLGIYQYTLRRCCGEGDWDMNVGIGMMSCKASL